MAVLPELKKTKKICFKAAAQRLGLGIKPNTFLLLGMGVNYIFLSRGKKTNLKLNP